MKKFASTLVRLTEYEGDAIHVFRPETWNDTVLIDVTDGSLSGTHAVVTLTADEALQVATLLLQAATILTEKETD